MKKGQRRDHTERERKREICETSTGKIWVTEGGKRFPGDSTTKREGEETTTSNGRKANEPEFWSSSKKKR